MTLNIVIVHCHFQPGGVTQVVQNHVQALAGTGEETTCRIVLAGSSRQDGVTETTRQLAQIWSLDPLDYDPAEACGTAPDPPAYSPAGLDRRANELAGLLVERMVTAGMTPSDTVVHWHNHSLGKNAALPSAIARLAEAGWPVLMQIHDFAEDQRPANYQHLIRQSRSTTPAEIDRWLYPEGANLSYATLTRGDAEALVRHGLSSDAVSVIPNNVRLPDADLPSREVASMRLKRAWQLPETFRWVLYPIRGIRRKNLGEFLLLCQCLQFGDGELTGTGSGPPIIGAITLRPDTLVETRSYDRWRNVAKSLIPNVQFDVAHHPDVRFIDNLAAAHCIVSTSVAEGFGMTFLEPWLARRPVVARRLSGVVADFEAQGVQLDSFYESIQIPGTPDWLADANRRWSDARRDAWSAIAQPMRPSMRADGKSDDPASASQTVDFARLTPDLQIDVIRRCHADRGFQKAIIDRNDQVLRSIIAPPPVDVIEANAQVIAKVYSLSSQRRQLLDAYERARRRAAGSVPQVTLPAVGSSIGDSRPSMVDLIDAAHPFYPCRVEQPGTNS